MTDHTATAFRRLYDSLRERPRPEDVAEVIQVVLEDTLSPSERAVLDQAARGSLKRGIFAITSMMQTFQKPVAPQRQAERAQMLFPTAPSLSRTDCLDAAKVRAFLDCITQEIRKIPQENDFLHHRLNTSERKAAGLELSRRRYNKLFRFLSRFEKKLATYEYELRKYRATLIAKSGLASTIERDDFMACPVAACFAAYYTARTNRRSVFTNKSQDRAFDTVARMLLARFRLAPSLAGWRVIARVMPDADVVFHLDEADKLILFGQWWQVLEEIAALLEKTWQHSKFNRATMIVSRGDDSTTWNALAGAWNNARQGWLSLVYAMGMENILERVCFGKVMRLMAADVAAWHASSGGKLEPDTLVWAALPAPWEVLTEKATCTRNDIIAACQRHGVDPGKKGWVKPRSNRQAVPFSPTPELVHGVIVSHPALAGALRQAGWFSGKTATPLKKSPSDLSIHRDETGAVIRVEGS